MGINGISTYQTPAFRMMDCGRRAGTSPTAFDDMASETKRAAITLYLPRENTVYSGGRGTQTVYAEYTQASTPEDPIVRIKGVCGQGEYEFTCHLNDIDPRHASYAELCALWGHLKETGQSGDLVLGYPYTPVLPYGIDVDNVLAKRDYASLIQGMTTSTVFDASNQRTARELLDLYSNWNQGKTEAAERLSSLPIAHTRLNDAQIQELARKYGGGRLSQSQYDDLLDELVHRGVLTRDEIKYMGCQGVTVTPPGCDSWCYRCDEYGNPLEDVNGNPLDWTKKLMGYLPQGLSVFGLFYHEQVPRDAFDALQDTLERMNAY